MVGAAPQYTTELFLVNTEDSAKFRAAFKNRASYTKQIRDEIKEWVKENLARWKVEKQDWFKIGSIPDNMIPDEYVLSADEVEIRKRRRSSITGLKESMRFDV